MTEIERELEAIREMLDEGDLPPDEAIALVQVNATLLLAQQMERIADVLKTHSTSRGFVVITETLPYQI